MGHFAKIKEIKKDDLNVSSYDPKNPFSRNIEDEGTWIEIKPTRVVEEEKEEEENGSTNP